jgi:putative multiple sugar transport system substrate-binding protein
VKGIKSVVTAIALGALAQTKGTIGLLMPTRSSARWIDDGDKVQSASGRSVKSWRA